MSNDTFKLFKINLDNFSLLNSDFYVVAKDLNAAYELVQKHLRERDLLTPSAREMRSIELIAENVVYPKCGTKLLIEWSQV